MIQKSDFFPNLISGSLSLSLSLTHTHTHTHTYTHHHHHHHHYHHHHYHHHHSINGDHIPDLFAVVCGDEHCAPTFFISGGNRTSFTPLLLNSSSMPDLTSSYFIDLDSDCLSELVLYRETNKSMMKVWKHNRDKGLGLVSNLSLSSILSLDSNPIIGLLTFADMGECSIVDDPDRLS